MSARRTASLPIVRSCLWLLPAVTALACNPFNKASDCNRLARLVNQHLDGIEERAKQKTPANYRALAGNYRQLVADIRKQTPAPPLGIPTANELADQFEAAVPALDAYATALETHNTQRISEAERRLEHVARQEQQSVTRLEAYCRPR